jgi:hypothetical protein
LVGDLLLRVKPSPKVVTRFMAAMGEKDTIVHHPELIESLVAAGRDPIASATALEEYRALLSPLGFRSSVKPQDPNHRSRPKLGGRTLVS